MRAERSPGLKLLFALIVSAVLTIPLFTVYLLVYDRQNQSNEARTSIAQGWGGPQTLAGPMLVIPYETETTETVTVDNKPQTRTTTVQREFFIAPTRLQFESELKPQRRARSIYETVVYDAALSGHASYALPTDLERMGVARDRMKLDQATLRFGVSDPRGLGTSNRISAAGGPLTAQPGNGLAATNGSGFFATLDASAMLTAPLPVDFAFDLRGNGAISLLPSAGETRWRVHSSWPSPSFTGGFLPESHDVKDSGFTANYRISNLALGSTLAATEDKGDAAIGDGSRAEGSNVIEVGLIQPVDLYAQVNRSVKYGFLFIGFTFMAFFLFDAVAGVRVSPVEYLLVGAGLVLFFVMLLAFAEVIGFTLAYLVAAGAIIGLLTAYSSAVLRSRRRGGTIAGLLTALYAVLYVLLSLEAYSLLIGSLLVFAALASVMYLTRNLDWGGKTATSAEQN